MWRLALLVVLALSVRAQDVINLRSMPLAEDSDRLLTSVRQPVIVEANVPNITVGFKTGPNIPGTQFTIKCVLEGEACDAPPQGQPVSGSLPVKPAAVEGTVQGLDVDQTYSCFVETTLSENGKVSFCQEATPSPGIVRFELKFPGYRDAAAFGQQDREQVCANVLSLQPGGTCTVLRVVNGSAIVFIQVEDDDYRNTWSLTETLAQNETEVTAALTSGLEGSVEIADIQTEPPLPSPLPPTGVTANPSSDCMPSVVVTWTAPQRSSTITGYFVSCKSMTAPTANSTVAATQRNVSLSIQAGEEYMCSVVSQGPSGTSVPADASSLVMYRYPVACKPGEVSNVATGPVTGELLQSQVTWEPAEETIPPILGYKIVCNSTDGLEADVRTVEVPESPAIVGDGEEENGPLPQGADYTCSVAAYNAAGDGQPVDSSSFMVPAVINKDLNKAYETIQAAIDDPNAETTTISVGRGTFKEYISIEKSITLLGPNAGVLPYNDAKDGINPSRNLEAKIEPPNDSRESLIRIRATEVTMKGFTITLPLEGEPSWGIHGADDISEGGPAYNVSGLTVEDMILEGGLSVGMIVRRTSENCSPEATVNQVTFKRNFMKNTFAQPFYMQCASGNVEDNVVLNGYSGVQIQPYTGATFGTVQNNVFKIYSRGIYLNFIRTNPVDWTVTGNAITLVPEFQPDPFGFDQWTGIYFRTTGPFASESPFLTVTGNTINMGTVGGDYPYSVYGIYFRNYQLMIEDSATISGNNLTGSGEITAYISALNNQNENGDIIDLEIAEKLENENQFSEDTAVSDDPCCEIVQIV
ncbi:hypothetical protein PSENEW3_00002777 [Picochlorum sp. SENEW3]|nr:hypothetical protein PSENEW3_00002777 [Picochlorum sp. SENEW3]